MFKTQAACVFHTYAFSYTRPYVCQRTSTYENTSGK